MANNSLKARIEVLGGDKVVRTFEAFGSAAARNFDRMDREADQSARRIRALERDLLRLKAIAETIRASIKIDTDKDPTPAQKDALKALDDVDARAAAVRAQISEIDDAMTMGRGRAFQAIARDMERDRLESIRFAKDIADKIDDLRKKAASGQGSVISEADLKKLETAGQRMEAVSDNWLRVNAARLDKIETADRKAFEKRERDAERFRKAQEDKAWKEHETEEARLADLARVRREAEEKAAREFAEVREATRRDDYRAWWKDTVDRQDAAAKADRDSAAASATRRETLAKAAKSAEEALDRDRVKRLQTLAKAQAEQAREQERAAAEREKADRDSAEAERKRLDRQRQAIEKISEQWRKVAAARKAGGLAELEVEEERARRREADRQRLAGKAGLDRGDVPPVRSLDGLLSEKGLFSEAEIARIRKFDAQVRGVHTRLGAFLNSRALKRVGDDADGMSKSLDRAGKSMDGAGRKSGGLAKQVGQLGRGLKGAGGNAKRFVTSMKSLERAVGNTALRTGVAGILGGLGLGVGAVGGVAVAGGILGAGGLAAFDGAALKRTAQTLGMTTEYFSKLRYASDKTGVGIDTVAGAIANLRSTMMAATNGEIDPFLRALEDGNNQYRVKFKLVERTQTVLAKQMKAEKAAREAAGKAEDGKAAGLSKAQQKTLDDAAEKALTEEKIAMRDVLVVFEELFDLFAKLPDGEFKMQVAAALGVTELLPMLNRGRGELERLFQDAERMGVAVSDSTADKFQEMREQLYDAWAGIIGLGYELAIQMAPYIEQLAGWFVKWITENRREIVGFLVSTFKWIANAVADFINLFRSDGLTQTHFAWTRFVYDGLIAIRDAAVAMWQGLVKGWEYAKPVFDWIGEKLGLGKDSGLKVALGFLGANLLGIVRLVTSVGSVFLDMAGLVLGAVTGIALPAVGLLLKGLAAVIGWPALLLLGTAAVAGYWDDITALFTAAWAKFKETFPETAALLESKFKELVEPVQWLIDLVSGIMAPVRMVFDAIASLFNFFTGYDITGTQLMLGLTGLLFLVQRVTTAVGLLTAALGGRAAAGAVAGAAGGGMLRGGLYAAFAALASPAGVIAMTGTALGVVLFKLAEYSGLADWVGGYIDKWFFEDNRERMLDSVRAADEAFMRAKEANGGVNPGRKVLGLGRAAQAWDGAALQGTIDSLNRVETPFVFSGPAAQGNERYDTQGRPVNLYINGDKEPIRLRSHETDLEQKVSRAQRTSVAHRNSWNTR